MTPRYILAKYVPDLGRMEPRNIGVFVWWKGKFCAKFLESSEVEVNDPDTYERWTAHWAQLINKSAIHPKRGAPVSKNDPACIDALLSTQKGNYILVDSGELLNKIPKCDLGRATAYLFDELVASPEKHLRATKAVSFSKTCDSLLQQAGIEFKYKHPIECTWNGVSRHLHPDYYIGNGKPDGILQRAKLTDEVSINGAALLIHVLLDQGIVQRNQCRFLVRSQDIATNPTAKEGMALFERLCGVIDVESDDVENELHNFSPDSIKVIDS